MPFWVFHRTTEPKGLLRELFQGRDRNHRYVFYENDVERKCTDENCRCHPINSWGSLSVFLNKEDDHDDDDDYELDRVVAISDVMVLSDYEYIVPAHGHYEYGLYILCEEDIHSTMVRVCTERSNNPQCNQLLAEFLIHSLSTHSWYGLQWEGRFRSCTEFPWLPSSIEYLSEHFPKKFVAVSIKHMNLDHAQSEAVFAMLNRQAPSFLGLTSTIILPPIHFEYDSIKIRKLRCYDMDPEFILKALAHWPCLEHLIIQNAKELTFLGQLSEIPGLRFLELHFQDHTWDPSMWEPLCRILAHCASLEKLVIHNARRAIFESPPELDEYRCLQPGHVEYDKIRIQKLECQNMDPQFILKAAAHWPHLEHLIIYNPVDHLSRTAGLNLDGCESIRIQKLECRYKDPQFILRAAAHWLSLEHLIIYNPDDFTFLGHLSGIAGLRRLELYLPHTPLDPSMWEILCDSFTQCASLNELDIQDKKFTYQPKQAVPEDIIRKWETLFKTNRQIISFVFNRQTAPYASAVTACKKYLVANQCRHISLKIENAASEFQGNLLGVIVGRTRFRMDASNLFELLKTNWRCLGAISGTLPSMSTIAPQPCTVV